MSHLYTILTAIFIFLASLIPLQTFFAKGISTRNINFLNDGCPNLVSNVLYALVLFLFFLVFRYLVFKKDDDKESFFFEVSNCKKCADKKIK